jgi:hypothetical protein
LRTGQIISVDLSEALHNYLTVVPVPGNAVVVTGTFAASGVLHAHQMLRAQPSEALWEPDSGPQYRTEIFPQDPEQAKIAKAYVAQLDTAKAFPKPIVTKTATMKAAFYPAEGYHQDYLTLHPNQPYIVINDLPKVANLKRLFAESYRAEPVLVSKTGLSN